MKNKLITAFLFTITLSCFSQNLVLPPELFWWINEVNKANPEVAVEKFKLEYINNQPLSTESYDAGNLYPVFKRFNFSGNLYGYFNLGASLGREKDGRYSIDFDIDSGLLILTAQNTLLYWDSFGSISGIGGIAWLTDRILIGVGVYITEDSFVNLMIKRYEIHSDKIIISEYIYPKAFHNDIRLALKLNWYEQRPDCFIRRRF